MLCHIIIWSGLHTNESSGNVDSNHHTAVLLWEWSTAMFTLGGAEAEFKTMKKMSMTGLPGFKWRYDPRVNSSCTRGCDEEIRR